MKIGNWGSIIKFRVSDSSVLTFKEMSHSVPVQTQTHTRCNGKPRIQFVAPGLETVSFTMEIVASQYKKPVNIEKKLKSAAQNGTVAPLVIGNRVVLSQAIISNMSAAYDVVIMNGKIYSIKINVTMTEYV